MNTTEAPIVIAHRGYAKRYPENTKIAIEAALEAGACGVEFDIQFTADSVPVLLHDANLKRTTGTNKRIFSLDSSKVEGILVNEAKKHPKKFANVGIPTLASVVELLGQHKGVQAFVEIKQETLDNFGIEKSIKTLASVCEPIIDQCVLITYNALAVRCARAMGFKAVGWILTSYDNDAQMSATELAPDYLICNYTKLPKNTEKLWLGPWKWAFYEVTQAKVALQLAELGAHYVETMAVAELLKNESLKNRNYALLH